MSDSAPAVKTGKRGPRPPLYELLGAVGSTAHSKVVNEVVERGTWFATQLQDYWLSTVRWHRHYYAQRDEFRTLPEEAWRARVYVPLPYSAVETKTAIITDILTSIDPPIQAEGTGEEDYEPAMKVEKLLTYTLRSNHWEGKRLPGLIRMAAIQGTEAFKQVWADDTYEVDLPTGDVEREDFQKHLQDAFDALGIQSPDQVPDYMMDLEGFMEWRDKANLGLASKGLQIPEPPVGGRRTIVRYRGPKIERVPLYDLFIDPLVDDIQDQTLVVQRILKPESWVMAKVESGAWDGPSVEACIKQTSDTLPNLQDKRINEILGIKQDKDSDPINAGKLVEIWECFQLSGPVRYGVMLNRKGFVNKNPGQMPFAHGQIPIGLLRNVYVPGRALGISELQINESLFDEMNTMRELRIDRTKLETLPAFSYKRGMGMTELKRKLAPGMLLQSDSNNMFDPIFKYQPTNAFGDMALTERNIADATATGSNVKGEAANVGRVAASDALGRQNLALTRHKLQAVGFEDDLGMIPRQAIALFYQKGDAALRVRIAGAPDLVLNKNELLEALGIDYQFRGATEAINRDQTAQKLIGLIEKANPIMTPPEMRVVLRQVVQQLGLKQASRIVSREGDQHFQQVFEMAELQQKTQEMMIKQQAMATMMKPPTEVGVNDARALSQPGNGAPPQAPPRQVQ